MRRRAKATLGTRALVGGLRRLVVLDGAARWVPLRFVLVLRLNFDYCVIAA